jgi:hypothetical protein
MNISLLSVGKSRGSISNSGKEIKYKSMVDSFSESAHDSKNLSVSQSVSANMSSSRSGTWLNTAQRQSQSGVRSFGLGLVMPRSLSAYVAWDNRVEYL